jgi:hypothetical protein
MGGRSCVAMVNNYERARVYALFMRHMEQCKERAGANVCDEKG